MNTPATEQLIQTFNALLASDITQEQTQKLVDQALTLLDKNADPNADPTRSFLFSAVKLAHPSLVRALLEHGADPNHMDRGQLVPTLNMALDHIMLEHHNIHLVSENPELEDHYGRFEDLTLVKSNLLSIVDALLEFGAQDQPISPRFRDAFSSVFNRPSQWMGGCVMELSEKLLRAGFSPDVFFKNVPKNPWIDDIQKMQAQLEKERILDQADIDINAYPSRKPLKI